MQLQSRIGQDIIGNEYNERRGNWKCHFTPAREEIEIMQG